MTDQSEAREIAIAAPKPPAVVEGPRSTLAAIVEMAKDPTLDAPKLDVLLRMQERLEARQAEREFNVAFIDMKPELPVIEKDGRITYEAKPGKAGASINYATLEGIDEEVTPIMQRFGFAVGYRTKREPEGLVTVCVLRHRGGHSTETDGPPLPCDSSGGKNNIQGWGSAMKYGQRYSMVAALNIRIKGKDDDGKAAGLRYITDAQATEVRKLMVETGTDEAKFCEFIRVAEVETIQAGELAMVTNMLLSKRKSKRGSEQ